jgi:OFA family oxalate/formate antiporter-like MFS transporter
MFLPVSVLFMSFCPPIGHLIIARWPLKVVLSFGVSIALIGIFVSSFTSSVMSFIILYCACFGIGGGSIYLVPLICGWEYFPKKRGLVTGIVVGAFGCGAFFFSFIAKAIVNPENHPRDIIMPDGNLWGSVIADRVPRLIRILCAIWAVLAFGGILFIKRKAPAPPPVDPESEPMTEESLASEYENEK